MRPNSAYVTGTYAVLLAGVVGFAVGLWNAELQLSEKGYYFITLVFGLFAAISLQRVLRDRAEGNTVSGAYQGLCYAAIAIALGALFIGLWNATMLLSEKGFYAACFVLALFAAITAQKNKRDQQAMGEILDAMPYGVPATASAPEGARRFQAPPDA